MTKDEIEVLEKAFQVLVDNGYTFLATILANLILHKKGVIK